MSAFIARTAFPVLESLPRSYYLGHHAAGLAKMRTMLAQIDLIVECRDYRVPITSHNPQFEDALAGKERMIVYTKKDLGRDSLHQEEDKAREALLRKWHHPYSVQFSDQTSKPDIRTIIERVKQAHVNRNVLTGSFLMVVGMPNVGKSSLINALRRVGVNKAKAAKTGGQPGVTRKIAKSGVKIVEGSDESGNVYLVDTPGVFIPYVPDSESMLKLALCGSVKDTVVPPITLADYLLYKINQQSPQLYSSYAQPTNEITEILSRIAKKTGRLGEGGTPDLDAAALWLIQKWREGEFGRFVLDSVTEESLQLSKESKAQRPISLNQARRASKDALRLKSIAARSGRSEAVA